MSDKEEMIEVSGKLYPTGMVERAYRIMEKTNASWGRVINAVIEFDEAKRHSEPVDIDPDEFVILVFRGSVVPRSVLGSKGDEDS